MNLQDIQKLIAMLEKSNLSELELETGGMKIRLSRCPAPAPAPSPQFVMIPSGGQAPAPQSAPQDLAPPPSAAAPAPAAGDASPATSHRARAASEEEVKSPMVGTFYRSPAPGAEPFVKVGDRVRKGQTLCIIEAMKLMNEIECESDGVIVEILTENAQPVEYGEVLMHIDPAG